MTLTPGANRVPTEHVEIVAGALAQPSPALDVVRRSISQMYMP